MSSTILSGDFTVYYTDDTGGDKQIRWSGSATGTRTVNELYSALQDLFDDSSGSPAAGLHMAEGVPMSAQTPTQYTIGRIETNDTEPWFIDETTIHHLTDGSLQTSSWTRVTSTATGIVKISRSGTNIVAGDIGYAITNGTGGDAGRLLFVSDSYLWIRPDSNAAANNWDSTSGTITCNGHADTQTGAAVTGENIWTNIFTLGTIVNDTQIYMYQNQTLITQWWSSGHVDVLILVQDMGTLIDTGLITIYARQYGTLYDHYTADISAGTRTPIPLATSNDVNNDTGYRTFSGTSGSGTFNVGNYLYVGASWNAATKKGVITAVDGYALTYYLIGDLSDFALSDAIKEYNPNTGSDGDATCTASTPSASGPNAAPSSTLTISFGGIERDLLNGNGNRPYSVELDLQKNITVALLYERLKYLTRRGQSTDIDTETSQTIIGREYTSIGDYYVPYDTGSVDNPFTEGETITATGNFRCTLTSKHDQGSSEGFLIVRNVRGTIPVDNTTLTGTTSTHTAAVDTDSGNDPVSAIIPIKQAPFGTFAGGRFFGARGVWLKNVPAADATKYELIDSEGVPQSPPNTIAIIVNSVDAGDKVSVFRTTGDNEIIDRAMYTSHATNNTLGSSTFEVTSAIDSDTPASGYIRVVDNSLNREQRYAYTSWTGSIFTLNGVTLDRTYDDSDTAYVPFIDTTATGDTVSQSVTYAQNRYVLVVVRYAGFVPFKIRSIVNSGGMIIPATKTTDSVYQI